MKSIHIKECKVLEGFGDVIKALGNLVMWLLPIVAILVPIIATFLILWGLGAIEIIWLGFSDE